MIEEWRANVSVHNSLLVQKKYIYFSFAYSKTGKLTFYYTHLKEIKRKWWQ